MLTHMDQGNIADFFPGQSCSWAVGQHCTGKQFSCATLAQADQDNIIQVIFQQKHVCALCANIGHIFLCAMLSQKYLDNTDQTIFLCNDVVPVWLIHCIGYFLHKSCLLVIGQHYTGKNLVQCCPRGSSQRRTGKNPVQCCLITLRTTLHRSKPYVMLSLRLQTTMHRKKSCSMLS